MNLWRTSAKMSYVSKNSVVCTDYVLKNKNWQEFPSSECISKEVLINHDQFKGWFGIK